MDIAGPLLEGEVTLRTQHTTHALAFLLLHTHAATPSLEFRCPNATIFKRVDAAPLCSYACSVTGWLLPAVL